MTTWHNKLRTVATKKVEQFTGEGAYHGSTKQKPTSIPQPKKDVTSEMKPTTLERYIEEDKPAIDSFTAFFGNSLCTISQGRVPTQEEVRTDGVTFCWCPFDEAYSVAGPLTRSVLQRMRTGLTGKRKNIYVDSKIQYFETGDFPVDSCLRHVDGSIAVRDERVLRYGVPILHDMKARLLHGAPPMYMAYQSSDHCATGFLNQPLILHIPELIPNFNDFDAAVQAARVPEFMHPAGAILAYDGLTIHWARSATAPGWRLWIRCVETDETVVPNESVIECYDTVFRPGI
jgi:hypothetical protein